MHLETEQDFSYLPLEDTDLRIQEHEAMIKHLEATIMDHHRSIMKLREHRNSLTACAHSRLPSELFYNIFQIIRNDAISPPENGYNWMNSADFYSWISVMHVCRLWRNVALSNSSLFSHIILPTRNLDLLGRMLAFSRESYLHIVVTRYVDSGNIAWKRIWPHLPRMKTLHLWSNPPSIEWPLCPFMTSFHCLSGPYGTSSVPWASAVRDLMPNLKSLSTSVWCYGPDWYRHPLPSSLTTLSIVHPSMRHVQPSGTMRELVEALGSSTMLHSLNFSSLGDEWYRPSPSGSASSSLDISHLKSITLQGAVTPIVGLLSHVVRVERVDITTTTRSDEMLSLPKTLRHALSPLDHESPSSAGHRVQLTMDTMRPSRVLQFRLDIWTDTLPISTGTPLQSPNVHLDFYPDSLENVRTLTEEIANQLSHYLVPTTHVTFNISGGCGKCLDEVLILLTLAQALHRVTHLEFVLGDIRDLSVHNIVASLPHVVASLGNAVLPELKVLRVDANTLLGCFRVQPLRDFFKLLREELTGRLEHGLKLERLEFDISRCMTLPLMFDDADPLVALDIVALRDLVGEIVPEMPNLPLP